MYNYIMILNPYNLKHFVDDNFHSNIVNEESIIVIDRKNQLKCHKGYLHLGFKILFWPFGHIW